MNVNLKYMNISGRIYEINTITDNIANVVLIKTRYKKKYFVSLLFYYQMSGCIHLNYKKDDFVKIWFRPRSNQRKTDREHRYFTDLIGEKILLKKRDGVKTIQVKDDYNRPVKGVFMAEDTGEIIPLHSLKEELKKQP